MKTIFTLLEEMIPSVRERRWDELEATYNGVATKLAGRAKAAAIAAVDLDEFQSEIRKALKKAVSRARKAGAKAVYFEYDLDNRWDSNFFICPDYTPQSEGDEDWACDFDDDLPGPGQREFALIYQENPSFDRPPAAMGTTLYMVARTVASFGRAMDDIPDESIVICMAFHDQDPIMRMREPGAGAEARLDKTAFPSALAKAIALVLERRRRKLSAKTLDCLAIDVHPWSGFLNLCIRATDDEAPRTDGSRVLVADWELSGFAKAHSPKRESGAWPEASGPLQAMKAAFAAKPKNVSDDEFAGSVYALCATAAREPLVWDALDRFERARDFSIVVNNVDSPERSIVVRKPRKRSGK